MQIYNNEILKVLAEAGNDGLSVKKIARHVHNAHNTLFSNVSFDEVYAYVGQYLKRNSKCADSIIERTDLRGVYRINLRNEHSQQLMLQFQDEYNEKESSQEAMCLKLRVISHLFTPYCDRKLCANGNSAFLSLSETFRSVKNFFLVFLKRSEA